MPVHVLIIDGDGDSEIDDIEVLSDRLPNMHRRQTSARGTCWTSVAPCTPSILTCNC